MAKNRYDLTDTMTDAIGAISDARKGKTMTPESSSSSSKKHVRNVYLSDETLGRLELIKKRLNASRGEGEGHISVTSIMNQAIEEFLDKSYPETKELYQKMYSKL